MAGMRRRARHKQRRSSRTVMLERRPLRTGHARAHRLHGAAGTCHRLQRSSPTLSFRRRQRRSDQSGLGMLHLTRHAHSTARPSCESATPHAQRMSRRAGRVGRCDQTATPRPRKPGAPGEGLASAGSAPPPACDPAPSASRAATCRGDAAMRTRGACTRGLGAAKAVAAQRRAQNRLQAGWPQGWGVCGRVGGRQAGAK